MTLKVFIFAAIVLVSGCVSPIEKNPIYVAPQIRDSTEITDENILRAVYSNYKFPQGFYKEDLKSGSPYYENTVSIRSLNDRSPQWFELSTNDRDQAFAWSESSSVYSAYYRKVESEREDEKYFEFRRVWQEHPSDILLSRVHKASYLDRSMYDRFNPGDTLAIFRKSDVDTSSVKELIEYLWFIGYNDMGGAKALCSRVVDLDSSVQYILYYTMVSYGDWGLCDKISVIRSVYSVIKQTGIITESKSVFRSITGKCN
jgi:hypothetical protein